MSKISQTEKELKLPMCEKDFVSNHPEMVYVKLISSEGKQQWNLLWAKLSKKTNTHK